MSVRRLLQADGDTPVVAAAWQVLDPTEPWVPDAWRTHLPWAREYAHDDVQELYATPSLHVVGASVRGRVHANAGTHREDAMRIAAAPHLALLIAADGAGSSRWSRLGAETACHAALGVLRPALSPNGPTVGPLLPTAVAAACEAIEELARATGQAPREFRSTLLVAAWAHDASGAQLHAIQVGDGAMVAIDRDGDIVRLVHDAHGEYSGEVSAFVPDESAREARPVVLPADRIQTLLVMTDGVEDPFYPLTRTATRIENQLLGGASGQAPVMDRERPHGPVAFDPQARSHLREWLSFERRGENDDRTLLAAFRRVEEPVA